MLAPIGAQLAAIWAAAAKAIDNSAELRHAKLAAAFVLACVLTCALAGCLPATATLNGADPADPAARVPATPHRSATAPYTSLRPGEPGPWLEQNRRVAPVPKSEQ
jgi:hypothetical protein